MILHLPFIYYSPQQNHILFKLNTQIEFYLYKLQLNHKKRFIPILFCNLKRYESFQLSVKTDNVANLWIFVLMNI